MNTGWTYGGVGGGPDTFGVVVADPPWRFKDNLPGKKRGAAKHYKGTLSVAEICAFPDFHALKLEERAVLFLWRVHAMPEEAYQVMRAWGFRPHSEIVWDKTTKTGREAFGMGRIVRGSHEVCLIGVRGRTRAPAVRNIRSRFTAPLGRHSEKPERFYGIVEALYPGAAKVELFARRARAGWLTLGNEVPGGGCFTAAAAAA